MEPRKNLRLEQGAATRGALVSAARRLFAQKGYHGTGTEDVVAAAGVTRGSLYHHYRDKEALFEAVFREVATELFEATSLRVEPLGADRWSQLQEGLQAHLQLIAASRDMQRILLVDGPAVFGWSKWREMQSDFSLGALIDVMTELMAAGLVRPHPPVMAAHMVLSALNEAALLIAHAADPETARIDVGDMLRSMVAGLR